MKSAFNPRSILLFIMAGAVLIFYLLYSNAETHTYFSASAQFGKLSLTNQPVWQGRRTLEEKLNQPFYVGVENKSRGVTLSQIGVSIDDENLMKLTKECKAVGFLICEKTEQNSDPKTVLKIDDEKFNNFAQELNNQIKFMAQNTIISFHDYTFRKPTSSAQVSIDTSKVSQKNYVMELVGDIDSKSLIELPLKIEDNHNLQKDQTLSLIQQSSYPLLVKYGREPFYIPQENVSEFFETVEKDGITYGTFNDKKIMEYLELISKDYESEDVQLMPKEAVDSIKRALLYRTSDYEVNNAVVLPLQGKPKSGGEKHDVYLEVIKSQQRLYKFEKGKLTKTYVVSTGLTWETPPGQYQVLGKQKMTVSYYDDWFMPNYLPIGTINGYRFGFHEIPYHMDGAGNIYSRDPNTMGSPATGGCIQLTHEDSEELFNWAEIGTPVYIYE